jgi:hypothetical protein
MMIFATGMGRTVELQDKSSNSTCVKVGIWNKKRSVRQLPKIRPIEHIHVALDEKKVKEYESEFAKRLLEDLEFNKNKKMNITIKVQKLKKDITEFYQLCTYDDVVDLRTHIETESKNAADRINSEKIMVLTERKNSLLAELEKINSEMGIQPTNNGSTDSPTKGVPGGKLKRPTRERFMELVSEGKNTNQEIASVLGVKKARIYNYAEVLIIPFKGERNGKQYITDEQDGMKSYNQYYNPSPVVLTVDNEPETESTPDVLSVTSESSKELELPPLNVEESELEDVPF